MNVSAVWEQTEGQVDIHCQAQDDFDKIAAWPFDLLKRLTTAHLAGKESNTIWNGNYPLPHAINYNSMQAAHLSLNSQQQNPHF